MSHCRQAKCNFMALQINCVVQLFCVMQNIRDLHIARTPRPWLTRAEGECAFPVGGEGAGLSSCCNPSGAATYCPAHQAAMRGPSVSSAEAYTEAVLAWLARLERRR